MNEAREGENVDGNNDREVPQNVDRFPTIMEERTQINHDKKADGELRRNGVGEKETRLADRNGEEKTNNPRSQSVFRIESMSKPDQTET